MNLLAVDYGRKHVGIACSTTSLAEPVTSISLDQSISYLQQYIKTHPVEKIILGLPEGPISKEVQKYAQVLKQQIPLPIELYDETLSSQLAKKNLKHAKRSKRSGPDHHFAAAVFLQDYLDHAG